MNPWWAVLLLVVGGLAGAAAAALVRRRPAPEDPGPEAPPVPPLAVLVPGALPQPAVPEDVVRVLDVLPGPAVLVDPRGRVMHATEGARALDLVRDGALRLDELTAMVREAAQSRTPVERQLLVRRGPHTKVRAEVAVRVAPFTDHFLLLLAEDLSESHRVEAVRRDFVANVSHELKTPVGALSLLAEAVLAAKDDPEAVAHFAGRMQVEAARLGALVTDVIDLSRLQGGEPLPPSAPVSVDAVVSEAVDATRQLAAAKAIDVVRGGDAGLLVPGHEGLLATALRNLLSNAINYSPDHTRVAVAVRGSDGLVEISVTDQGIGIPADELDRIFERFYRVDPARSRGTGGTGLGLAIVKHVAVNHGGDVGVWSRPGEGSTFTLRLPALDTEAPAWAPADDKEKVP